MADALCGPSNAVQNLAKQTSVDRTLQQDRLVSRQLPSQAFRSHDPTAASLDPEFEAFQAGPGPGPAFTRPPFAAPSFSALPSQSPLQAAPAAQSAAWAQDFHRLNISPHPQHQHVPQPWHSHFSQDQSSPASFQSPSSRIHVPPAAFPTPMAFRPVQAPQHALQSHQVSQAQQHAPQVQFDEAAFEAAFDAAMADAATNHHVAMDEHDIAQAPFEVDIYPHLPLFRLVLANALIANTDESLHKAAKVVDALARHPSNLDPVQATLFRPLLSALNDPKRSLFAQRYGIATDLENVLDGFSSRVEGAHLEIDHTTEQMLASYADLLWQRNESNHLQPVSRPSSADNGYWLDQYYQDQERHQSETITDESFRLLTEGFQRQIITNINTLQAQALNRVLGLELDAYSKRSTSAGLPVDQSASLPETQAQLFNLMEAAFTAPETVEALEDFKQHAATTAKGHIQQESEAKAYDQNQNLQNSTQAAHSNALQDYQVQLMLLEQENQKRRLLSQSQQEASEEVMSDPSHHQYEEQAQPQQQMHSQEQDDELARTAADLLDRVSDNTTNKFKNSAFLGLMRQLADREVRVEGDKMVPTSDSARNATSNVQQATPTNAAPPQDGQEVVDLLNQPNGITTDQDPEFMMTSPFASASDY